MKIIDKNLTREEKRKLEKKLLLLQENQSVNERELRYMGWANSELTTERLFHIIKQEGLVKTKYQFSTLWMGIDRSLFNKQNFDYNYAIQAYYKMLTVPEDQSPNKSTILKVIMAHVLKKLEEKALKNEELFRHTVKNIERNYANYVKKYPAKNTRIVVPEMTTEKYIKDVLTADEDAKESYDNTRKT